MATYKTPGVYVEEISTLSPSVAEVETAIPAFIGYTEKGPVNVPKKISSILDYQLIFGSSEPEKGVSVTIQGDSIDVAPLDATKRSKNVLFYAMRLYFVNGGGPCYVVSLGNFAASNSPNPDAYSAALDIIGKEDEPTLLVFPDAPYLIPKAYYNLIGDALKQCELLGDRFVIIDVLDNPASDLTAVVADFRNNSFATDTNKKYGAAYFPNLNTDIHYNADEGSLLVTGSVDTTGVTPVALPTTLETVPDQTTGGKGKKSPAADSSLSFATLSNASKTKIRNKIKEMGVELTPCAAVAGVYARVDKFRGVWKAPANEPLQYVNSLVRKITDEEQSGLNIDPEAGRSINAIRFFTGQGRKIWGARTLDGNSNEWRYISIRRFFNMVEESVKKSTGWAVFEPNDVNTWTKVRATIENYLILKWKDGALAGAKPDDAFYVKVGLGLTMTSEDINEGRMIVEIGMAAVKPAEFIILRFMHKQQVS